MMRTIVYVGVLVSTICSAEVIEAPSGLSNQTNGLVDQATFDSDREAFDEVDTQERGLGPLYNAQSCRECHQTPTSGGASQITELRVGHRDVSGAFQPPSIAIAGGTQVINTRTLVNDRAICPNASYSEIELQERVPDTETIQALRLALPIFGDGLIEAIPDQVIIDNRNKQCASKQGICGTVMVVPIVEYPGATAVGKFGWKAQHASLLSFAGDAYLNEMGVTNRLFPDEVTNLCSTALQPNDGSGGERGGGDLDRLARFMRALMPPSRDQSKVNSDSALKGAELFNQLGCATCHVPTYVTAPAGTLLHGNTYMVSEPIANKAIHPYSDFLLHDVGTGDGIEVIAVENFGKKTKARNSIGVANKLRTPPLWGLRLRSRMMHDGLSVTYLDVIQRHHNEALRAARAFNALSRSDQEALYEFLKSL
jgi:CxxC motif-containing protein (DUF1111 family)